MGAFQNLNGKRFGRLIVIGMERRLIGKRERIYWKCRCDCGGETSVEASNLTTGHARSCKCLQRESRHFHTLKHGQNGTTAYNIWKGMRRRCLQPSNKSFRDYGGRGIKICKRWDEFKNFLADMGPCPEGKSLDRINNSGPYSPKNCRWADRLTQANNTRTNILYELNGQSKTLTQWSREFKIPYHRVHQRINKLKWPLEKALSI